MYTLESESKCFCVRAQHSEVVPSGNYSGSGCGGFLLLKSFMTARLSAGYTITYPEATGLIFGLLYCAHGNTLAFKLIIRSFPALFYIKNQGSLPCALSVRNRAQVRPWSMLSKISSHGEEKREKAMQLSELLRQPQEHELSVTSVTTALRVWRSPGCQQSAFGHPFSKTEISQDTQHLPRESCTQWDILKLQRKRKRICGIRESCRSAALSLKLSADLGLLPCNLLLH